MDRQCLCAAGLAGNGDLAAGDYPHLPSAVAVHEGCSRWVVLGHEYRPPRVGNVTSDEFELLMREYQEINAHLRTNTAQFVNWFSFFLTFSLLAAATFLLASERRAGLHGLALAYGVPIVCLMLHALAFAGILIFRRYITAAHRKIDDIIKL